MKGEARWTGEWQSQCPEGRSTSKGRSTSRPWLRRESSSRNQASSPRASYVPIEAAREKPSVDPRLGAGHRTHFRRNTPAAPPPTRTRQAAPSSAAATQAKGSDPIHLRRARYDLAGHVANGLVCTPLRRVRLQRVPLATQPGQGVRPPRLQVLGQHPSDARLERCPPRPAPFPARELPSELQRPRSPLPRGWRYERIHGLLVRPRVQTRPHDR